MISKKEVLKAIKTRKNYKVQMDRLNRGDLVEYIGGSNSQYLKVGAKYRLTSKPYGNRVIIINDNGVRCVFPKDFFI